MTSDPAVAGSEDELDPFKWDEVVDFVCAGSGDTIVAAAVAAEFAGFDAMLVSAGPVLDGKTTLDARLGVTDPDSAAYLKSLTDDTGALAVSTEPAEVPVCADVAPPSSKDFYGGRLRQWAIKCLDSPYGVICTTPTEAAATRAVVGAVGADLDLHTWLTTAADDAAVTTEKAGVLRRLVFLDGRVVGVVVEGPAGESWVKAVLGVVLTTGAGGPLPVLPADTADTQLRFVSRAASRFARLELAAGE